MGQPGGKVERYSEKQVFDEEKSLLRKRREAAGFPKPGPVKNDLNPKEPSTEEVVGDTVGLALSGGGVRSAAFSLGLIQALHRFGVLRFVDFISAASGGTYTVGMLSKAVKPEHTYVESEFRLAAGQTGKDSEFVRGVRQRGNYLLRLDKLIAPYLPNFLLNLVPRLALLLAIGALIAFVWRILDFEGVRDYYRGIGYDNDYLPALTPAIVVSFLWMSFFVLAIILKSVRLQWIARGMTWLTLATILISFAVLMGNGDITLSRPDHTAENENRVFWFNNLWTPMLSLVGIGCIPLLVPRKLMRSGTDPSGWLDSWIFYYASLALFIGVPLLSIAWFARENISSFNTYRGSSLARGDIKDDGGFYRLAAGELNGDTIEFPNQGIEAVLAAPMIDSEIDNLTTYRKLADKLKFDAAELLAESRFPPQSFPWSKADEPLKDKPTFRNSYTAWHLWGFFGVTLDSLIEHLFDDVPPDDLERNNGNIALDSHPAYTRNLHRKSMTREMQEENLQSFNRHLQSEMLFRFRRYQPKAREEKELVNARRAVTAPSDRLKLFLGLTSADIDEWTGAAPTDLKLDTMSPERTQYAEFNRLLLEAAYPEIIRDRSEVRRTIVINHDQAHRAVWVVLALGTALIVGWFINPNSTNSHAFYRDSLAATYLFPEHKPRSDEALAAVPLPDVNMAAQGLPYPLFNAATVDRSSWRIADQLEAPFVPFLLSPEFVGNSELEFIRTRQLGEATPTIADAMAISGAALNPAYFVQHFVAFLMGLLNLRLGQSLPNPKVFNGKSPRPSMLREFLESIFDEPRERSHVLLTDGGHVDNLAVETLLKRRCRVIIVCDSGHDPDHGMDDFAKVLRRLESEHGIRISDISPSTKDDTTPGDGHPVRIPRQLAVPIIAKDPGDARSKLDKLFTSPSTDRHFFVARILYPECGAETKEGSSQHPDKEGRLIYVKPCLTGDEGVRLYNYAMRHREFPHEPTHDQAFDEAQFDSYRRLGFHSGLDLCSKLNDPILVEGASKKTLWSKEQKCNAVELMNQLLPREGFIRRTELDILQRRVRTLCKELLEAVSENDELRRMDIIKEFSNLKADLGKAADVLLDYPELFETTDHRYHDLALEWDVHALKPLTACIGKAPMANSIPDMDAQKLRAALYRALRWMQTLERDLSPLEFYSAEVIHALEQNALWQQTKPTAELVIELLKPDNRDLLPQTKDACTRALRSISRDAKSPAVRKLARIALGGK